MSAHEFFEPRYSTASSVLGAISYLHYCQTLNVKGRLPSATTYKGAVISHPIFYCIVIAIAQLTYKRTTMLV